MNEQITKIAQEVAPEFGLSFAVVVKEAGKRYGLYDISTEDGFKTATEKLVLDTDHLPAEVRGVAFGVLNTHFMTKNGSEYPLFMNVIPLDTNEIDTGEIDWAAYGEREKSASKPGYMFNGVFLPLDTRANVRAASDLMDKNSEKFPGKDRIKFATAIKRQGAALKVKTSDVVEKYAYGTVNPEIYKLLDDRIKLACDYPETRAALEKIREDANTVPVDKTAGALEIIDGMLPFSVSFEKKGHVLGSQRPIFFSTVRVPDAYETAYGVQIRPATLEEKVAMIPDEKLMKVFTGAFVSKLRGDLSTVIKTAAPQVISTLKSLIE